MLSNTMVPPHYAAFRDRVLAAEIPVCEEISLEMQRIDEKIANPDYYFDDTAIEGFIAFCEAELVLTDGEDVHMLDSFKLWSEQLLGWYEYRETTDWDDEAQQFITAYRLLRLHDMQYLIVARGSAKSMYVSFLQAYFLTVDGSTTQQITVAPTMKQAEEVLTPIKTAIVRSKGPLFRFLTAGSKHNTTGSQAARQQLTSTKKGIENFLTNSSLEVRPMSIDKCQGLRSKYNSVDEWLSGDTRENVINALMQGARKFHDPILVAISSEGTVRNGVGDTIKLELAAILRGDLRQDKTSIWHYKLDDVKEVGNPRMWPKANPNLGITVSYETYHADVQRAEQFPSIRNEILAKRFGLPMEGFTFYFTYEETLVHLRKRAFMRMPCTMGVDLSRGDDFCAFTWLFPLQDGKFGVKTRAYITRRTLDLLPGAARIKYQQFIDEGSLIIHEGQVLDMIQVFDDVNAYIIEMQWDVRALGFDPYNADTFMGRWVAHWGPHGIEKVIQGARTESVPLGELKILAAARELLFDEYIMQFTMSNAVVWEDSNGNRKLHKRRNDEKIDNVAALMDAYVAFKAHPEEFL